MVDILADPEMVGFKRERPIYQIRISISFDKKHVNEDYRIPYKSSKAECL